MEAGRAIRQCQNRLQTAQQMYEIALFYWEQARGWAKKLRLSPHHLEEIQQWEDEQYRIQTGELDYEEDWDPKAIEETLTVLLLPKGSAKDGTYPHKVVVDALQQPQFF